MNRDDLLKIDLNLLDQEWLIQPRLFLEWADKLTKAKEKMRDLKIDLDVVKAETADSIRNDPTDYDIREAPTIAMVVDAVMQQKSVKKAIKKLNTAESRVNWTQNMLNAIDVRKRALEKLVDLHGQKYFATPIAKSPEAMEIVDKFNKRLARIKTKKLQKKKDKMRKELNKQCLKQS